MSIITEFKYSSESGTGSIFAKEWAPPEGNIKAILQISHGIAEHIERYSAFAEYMASLGILVVGNDHLGHGRSVSDDEGLGFFSERKGWLNVVSDMRRLYEIERPKYPKPPYFMLGHSMGSFLARTYIIKYPGDLDGVILSGTGQTAPLLIYYALFVTNREIKKLGLEGKGEKIDKLSFGSYNKKFAPNRTVCDWLSRDGAVVDRYIEDPKCGFTASAGAFRDMFGGILFIQNSRNLSKMRKNLPVYFFSGDRDPVGKNGAGVNRAYRSFIKAGMSDVSIKLYPDGRHEMLNELNREEVYADIASWIESKIKSAITTRTPAYV